MVKKIFVFIISFFILIESISIFLAFKNIDNQNVQKKEYEVNKNNFAMFINDGTGYKEYNSNIVPTGYKLDLEKTICTDSTGKTLNNTISFVNGIISVSTTSTIYCYLYFDTYDAFAVYSVENQSLRFYKNGDMPIEGEVYDNVFVTKVFTGFEDEVYSSNISVPWNEYANNILNVEVINEIQPKSTAYWFYGFQNTSNLNLKKINTSTVENMSYMFYETGHEIEMLNLDLSNWDTSTVENMSYMFYGAGFRAKNFILDLSNWDTKKVENMSYMFYFSGYKSSGFNIKGLSNFNTINVKNMSYMFGNAGYTANEFKIDITTHEASMKDGTKYIAWDVSNVTNMMGMFFKTGVKSTTWEIGDLSSWNTGSVTTMKEMFYESGYSSNDWNVGNILGWNTSNVEDMSYMFWFAGYSDNNFKLNLSGWDTKNVMDMSGMFAATGYKSTEFELNLSGWDTGKVTNMYRMFYKTTGYYEDGWYVYNWNVIGITKLNTSKVTNMKEMFYQAGLSADYEFDLTTHQETRDNGIIYTAWDVSNVTNYSSFNYDVEYKIIVPLWKN